MEGKSCACAHSDLMGNISAAVCDLWSNEAVQYAEMFGGTTPAVFTEILGYDVAQMNTALKLGYGKVLRDIFIASDELRDPQSFVISPRIAYNIASSIVEGNNYYERALFGLRRAYEELDKAQKEEALKLSTHEKDVLAQCGKIIESLPEDQEKFISDCIDKYRGIVPGFRLDSYGLEGY
jgi:methanol--5-hydroxybenzimidazolylcobamide Co-methyltransferase